MHEPNFTCRNADRRPSPEEILQKQEAESWVYSSTMLYLYNIFLYIYSFFKFYFIFVYSVFIYFHLFIYLFILYIILGGLWAVSPLTGSIQNLLQTQQASPMHETPAREVLHWQSLVRKFGGRCRAVKWGFSKRIASELKTPFFGFIQRMSIQNLSLTCSLPSSNHDWFACACKCVFSISLSHFSFSLSSVLRIWIDIL